MCASPPGHPMEWRALVSLKAACSAKVISTNAVGALDFHCAHTHGTL
jgi:purine nucleoside phosphorylase